MKNVVLCGFMGTGKTVVGTIAARLLGRPFVDVDAEIAGRAGRSVPAIFAAEGEDGFRRREREAVAALAAREGQVVATGGGVLLDPANRAALADTGTLVLLTATPAALAARLADQTDRPLLAGATDLPARIAELLAARAEAYTACDHTIDTTDLAAVEVAVRIGRLLAPDPALTAIDVPGAAGHAPLAARERTTSRVVSGRGALARLGDELRACGVDGRVVVAMPPVVAEHHGEAVLAAAGAAGLAAEPLVVPDGDTRKTFASAVDLVDELAARGCDRDTCLVAAGGGVTGDLVGFAASLYMRGIALAMVPTTLLAMVDAHLGGKTGVNTPRAKNLAGAFHPPLLVLADPVFLDTLPDRELASGYAEVVKTALIGDAALLARLEAALLGDGAVAADGPAGDDPRRDPALLADCLAACAAVKGGVVTRDPWELGERRVLNLGHTLGHALEVQRDLGLAHGEAVAIGLVCALRLATERGLCAPDLLDRTRRLLTVCGLPTRPPQCDDAAVLAALKLDKKRRAGRLRFVLPRAAGRVEVVDDVTDQEALAALTGERACTSS